MFITGKRMPRRTFLRDVGTASLALPFLDAMVPARCVRRGAQRGRAGPNGDRRRTLKKCAPIHDPLPAVPVPV